MSAPPPTAMFAERRGAVPPFFSVCIPQYNRTAFLIRELGSLREQTFGDVEVCVSDDRSDDGRRDELLAWLDQSGLPYAYRVQERNRRYDGNLRTAIGLASGQYCLLMGNDDAFNGSDALERLRRDMDRLGPAGVVISDFADFTTGVRANRIRRTANYGAGPAVAATHFRNFSFVSGIVLERKPAQALATERWDGSEMYQTFVGCRMIAAGYRLLERADALVRKDITIPGEAVESYATKPRVWPCPVVERPLPLGRLGLLTADAIAPYAPGERGQRLKLSILQQLIGFTYPQWLFEYRRVQSWRFALGVALGMRPSRTARGLGLAPSRRLRLNALFGLVTLLGLTLPIGLFRKAQGRLYRIAKAVRRP